MKYLFNMLDEKNVFLLETFPYYEVVSIVTLREISSTL